MPANPATEPRDVLFGIRHAHDIIEAMRIVLVEETPAAMAVLERASSDLDPDTVEAHIIGLATIAVFALELSPDGFDKTLRSIMLRAEVDARPHSFRQAMELSEIGFGAFFDGNDGG